MLFKSHLTSQFRISGFRWGNTKLWLSGSLSPFLYSSSVYCFHLFLISSASDRFTVFLCFIVLIFAWNVTLISLIFLKRSLVFPFLFFCISLCCLLKKVSSPLAILWITLHSDGHLSVSPLPFTSLLFSAICKSSSDNYLVFCISFSWGLFWLPSPVQYYEPTSYSSSGTLSIRSNPLNILSFPLYNHKAFYWGHTWMT